MYWILRADLSEWEDEYLSAEIKKIPRGPMQEPFWWGDIPEPEPKPSFEFYINPRAPLVDNFKTFTEYSLYSGKFISILRDEKIRFETFRTTLIDKKTEQILDLDYQVFRLLEMDAILDEQKTIWKDHQILEGEKAIKKFVLNQKFLKKNVIMTRSEERRSLVIIHESLKGVLEKNNITGCRYELLETYEEGLSLLEYYKKYGYLEED